MGYSKIHCAVSAAAIVFAVRPGVSAQERVLYDFSSEINGPEGSLTIDSTGRLFGTTVSRQNGFLGGSVFELSRGKDGIWTVKVLYGFPDNSSPQAGLKIDAKGSLYGTAPTGGQANDGIVFVVTPQANGTWQEKVLHNFLSGPSDGSMPYGGVTLDAKGNLYGATGAGGPSDLGTIYRLARGENGDWTEAILFAFTNASIEGSAPAGDLIMDAEGDLYGVASQGGKNSDGLVFELSPKSGGAWQEKVLHTFGGSPDDGVFPLAGLVMDRNGNLYGTTLGGGTGPDGECFTPGGFVGDFNCGVAFELSRNVDGKWSERILHTFGSSPGDAIQPESSLVMDLNANLFGTTNIGGLYDEGTVYELSRSADGVWSEKILHDFPRNDEDGTYPLSELTLGAQSKLYGTTMFGGTCQACGTVFEIANPDITAVPRFSVPAGTYTATQKVTISDYTPGAKIYYTTNGDEPSVESSDEYSGPIEVKKTETIKAIAVAKDLTDSDLATAKYVIHLPTATPEITPPSATYHALQKVTITDATNEAAIYYTTDGKTPTAISKDFYRGPFRISATTTIKAMAIAPGRSQSKVATDTITIHLPPGSAAENIQP